MKEFGLESKNRNWYSDRYIVANVQKNILLIATVILAFGMLLSLILVKYVYENRSVEPYLIEIDKKTGQATVVESESVRKFTASEAIRESFVVKYIMARESYSQNTAEDSRNLLRVMTAKEMYSYYADNPKKQPQYELGEGERMANIDVSLRTITFTSPKVAEVKITKKVILDGKLLRKKFYRIRVVFDFFELDLPLEERYLNPLGFQVLNYDSVEEKAVDGYDLDLESGNLSKDDSKK